MTWLAWLIPSATQLVTSKPWQTQPEQDTAPQVDRPDNTGIVIVGLVAVIIIVLLIIILAKKA